MVTIIEGDLFETDAVMICHQVNCKSKMGSGVALQVKQKFPDVFDRYVAACTNYKKGIRTELLGTTQCIRVGDKIICNLFAQDNYGYDGKCYTDYDALRKCLSDIAKTAKNHNYKVAMPYLMGCHRGGGDWNTVYKMIEDVFADCNVILYKRGDFKSECFNE